MKQRKLSRQNHSGCGICKCVFVGLEERGGGKNMSQGWGSGGRDIYAYQRGGRDRTNLGSSALKPYKCFSHKD